MEFGMTIDISEAILDHLDREGLIGDLVRPDYTGYSILNVAPTVATFLGINLENGKPLQQLDIVKGAIKAEGISSYHEKVVLLFIDSLNKSMDDLIIDAVGEKKCVSGVLTSTFPSLTPTCTATMTTGISPISHGIVGFNILIEGSIYSIFELEPMLGGKKLSLDLLRKIFDLPDIFALCKSEGIDVTILLPEDIAAKESTTAIFEDIRIEQFESFKEMFLKVREIEDRFLYVYISVFDTILHDEGASSARIHSELSNLTEGLKSEIDNFENMLLFIIADHGQTQLNPENVLRLDDARLLECYTHPPAVSGGRIAYIYTDSVEEVESILEKEKDSVILMRSEDAVRAGLFGEGLVAAEFGERIGDLVLIAKEDTYLKYPYLNEKTYKSSHGALSREEMLVPFALIEF
jgi:hypothetical protein